MRTRLKINKYNIIDMKIKEYSKMNKKQIINKLNRKLNRYNNYRKDRGMQPILLNKNIRLKKSNQVNKIVNKNLLVKDFMILKV